MSAPPTLPAARGRAPRPVGLRTMAERALLNQITCVVIALLLWAFGPNRTLWVTLAYSLFIGNACWLFIDGGRELLARQLYARGRAPAPDWPGWAWFGPLVVLGTVGGYLAGVSLAGELFGHTPLTWRSSGPAVIVSVVASIAASYFFYTREHLAEQRLQAESAQRLASEVQLKLLQSQLEPHMLFNTLANLRVLIGLDPPRAQAMLDHLIRFLRSTLSATRVDRHALSAEFDTLRDYLSLMAVRMGPRLQAQFELPDALRDLAVPPLLLQPVVENAIKHGLEPQVEGGRIEIGARRERGPQGERLQLRVRDTGVGLAAASASDGTRFGLEQVRQRLAALYGESASLTLRDAADADGGTEVLILLPWPAAAAGAPPSTPATDAT